MVISPTWTPLNESCCDKRVAFSLTGPDTNSEYLVVIHITRSIFGSVSNSLQAQFRFNLALAIEWPGRGFSKITRRVFSSMSNSAAGVISFQFGACNRMAWTQFFQNCSNSIRSFGTGIRFPDSPLKKIQDSAGLMSRCSLTTIVLLSKESDTWPGFANFPVFQKLLEIHVFVWNGNMLPG